MTALASPPAVSTMTRRLTTPFARGADLLELDLHPGATGDVLAVSAYDFVEHEANFGSAPEASYVVRALARMADATTLVAQFSDPSFPGGVATTVVTVPDGTDAGDCFVVPLPPGSGVETRLVELRERVAGVPGADAAGHWAATVLLGQMARLLWVLGAERDRLTRVRDRVREQRSVETATGPGLDLLGADLGVPRFPPTPYSFDADTIALYHLDDEPGASPAVVDATGVFPGRTPHDGTLGGPVQLGRSGRYEGAAWFGAGTSVAVASDPDFDIPATGSFTVECFVRPDPATTVGTVVSRSGAGFGWSIEVGDVGLGVPGSVRATIDDGALSVQVVSAAGLPTDRFTHVAAALRRDPAHPLQDRWTLLVDGLVVDDVPVGGLAAVGGTGDVVIGPAATGFVGGIDEVRLSSFARAGFHPVLGEEDEQYRRRLGLFRRWVLPTPAALTAVLNRLVPEIDGVPDPFVVSDEDSPMHGGHHVLRVWPTEIAPTQSIDASGRLDVPEHQLWPLDDTSRDPALLGRHENPGIVYATVAADPGRDPALAPPDPHAMEPSVASALDRLVALLAELAIPGPLHVDGGFDQAAQDARATGRAVLLSLPGTAPGRLAALAHRAGFDLVEFRLPSTVYAACAPGHTLLLGPDGTGPQLAAGDLPELTVGDAVTLTFANSSPTWTAPTLPPDASVEYFSLATGSGRGELTTASPFDVTATLTAVAPGPLGLAVDVTRGGRVVTVAGCVVVRPGPMADGDSIAADGAVGMGIAALGPAEPDFDPAYLADVTDPRIDFGADPAHHLMQRRVAGHLTALADQLDDDGVGGTLRVLSAYDAGAPPPDPAGRGRVLSLRHTVVPAADLAVRAHRAGFDVVERSGATVLAGDAPADLVGVDGPDELEVGSSATLTVAPDPTSVSAATRLGWSSGEVVATTQGQCVQLTGATDPTVVALGAAPGVAWVRATLRDASSQGPYAFTVTLQPQLAGARIARDDYYLLMNALNTLHPVGVEVRTDALRAAVVELGSAPSGLDPQFTFPPFRLHRAAPGIRKGDTP